MWYALIWFKWHDGISLLKKDLVTSPIKISVKEQNILKRTNYRLQQ